MLTMNPRRRREKTFGAGPARPLDGNAKARIMARVRGLMRPTRAGRAYGALTAKARDVAGALLYGFHNSKSGRCFPSLEAIAEKAACAVSTVKLALKALEAAGVLTWANRLLWVRWRNADGAKKRVARTSNAYEFRDVAADAVAAPAATIRKADFRPRTTNQGFLSFSGAPASSPAAAIAATRPPLAVDFGLGEALARFRRLAGFKNQP